MQERLQKIIAAAGITSRRKAEGLIVQGRVTVNGQVVTELGSKADLERDHIKVNGKLLRRPAQHVYLLLNKPVGYVSTLSDPHNRPTVISLLKGVRERVYPVGRLDYHSSGLMILTNDGELANALMSRASAVPRTYHAKLEGPLAPEAIQKLEQGITLDGRRTAPARIRVLGAADERQPEFDGASSRQRSIPASNRPKHGRAEPERSQGRRQEPAKPWYEITLVEGRYHQVRRMFELAGQPVVKLKRTRIAFLTDVALAPGRFRRLTGEEVERLKHRTQRAGESTGEHGYEQAGETRSFGDSFFGTHPS